MSPMVQEYLFWGMSGILVLLSVVAIVMMLKGEHKRLLCQQILATGVILGLLVVILLFVAPQVLFGLFSSGIKVFACLLTLVILEVVVLLFLMPQSPVRNMLINGLLWLIGAIALVLGIIGAVLPVMPTTPFILITAACWGRASPRFHRWLYHHRFFGPMVRNWEEKRAIPKRAKYLAWSMMTLSSVGLLIRFPERWYVGVGTGLVCLCVGLWMARLPDA